MSRYSNDKNGYIVITTSIVLGVVILVLTISAGSMTFLNRRDVLDNMLKERSYFLARSCIEWALVKFADDNNYTGNETVDVSATEQCQILPFQFNPPNTTISTSATIDGIITNLELIVDASLNTISFGEQ
jgi:hypothetical protein